MKTGLPSLALLGWLAASFLGGDVLGGAAVSDSVRQANGPASASQSASAVFDRSQPVRLSLSLSSRAMASLRLDPRRNVDAVLREGDAVYPDVAVHLKGSLGSFRSVDDKPSLTLTFDKFRPEQEFCGLSKIHLNNSFEDPAFLNEWIGSELFAKAGIPTSRVGWALVELNGRRLGLYVLKEGFTPAFLQRSFGLPIGNLYEGSGYDLGMSMPLDVSGSVEDSVTPLAAAAFRETETQRRWALLTRSVDLERFITFMAMEVILGHRDGYCLARNNYRIYHNPSTQKLIFLPHGMDQLFGRADATITPVFAGQMAEAVRCNLAADLLYRKRLATLVTDVFRVEVVTNLVQQGVERIRPALSRREARAFLAAAEETKRRIMARHAYLLRRLAEADPVPLAFSEGMERLTNWVATDVPIGGKLEPALTPTGKPGLMIQAGPATMASWRCKVLLPAGYYRFEALAITRGVQPPRTGRNQGAGIRVGGVPLAQPHHLAGDSQPTPLSLVFHVQETSKEVELICELRAVSGRVWFELESLRVVRLPHEQ